MLQRYCPLLSSESLPGRRNNSRCQPRPSQQIGISWVRSYVVQLRLDLEEHNSGAFGVRCFQKAERLVLLSKECCKTRCIKWCVVLRGWIAVKFKLFLYHSRAAGLLVAVPDSRGEIGIPSQFFTTDVVLPRLRALILFQIGITQAAESRGVLRLDCQRLAVLLDRTIVLPVPVQDIAGGEGDRDRQGIERLRQVHLCQAFGKAS